VVAAYALRDLSAFGGRRMRQQSTQHSRKGTTPARANREEVQQLLDRMARAVTSGDGSAMAAMWETPALVLGDNQAMAVSSPQEVAQFFGGAKEQYNKRGITDTRAEIVRLHWPTNRIAVVEVRWPYLDERGATRGHETSTYTLHRADTGDLKLRVAVMHGATEA
jgi:hypothetical protein